MAPRQAIEDHLRSGEPLDRQASMVIRGAPLDAEGLLRNADATSRRYTRAGKPFVAISAEITIAGWSLASILAGPRLRTRRTYAAVRAGVVLDAGFELLATFSGRTTASCSPRTMWRPRSCSPRCSGRRRETSTSGGVIQHERVRRRDAPG